MAFERAERAASDDERRRWLTFVIVGGGPTGVELAGAHRRDRAARAAARVPRHRLARPRRCCCSRAGPTCCRRFRRSCAIARARDLERLGVKVRTGATVDRIERGVVHVGDERIEAGTILWAAGVAGVAARRARSACRSIAPAA